MKVKINKRKVIRIVEEGLKKNRTEIEEIEDIHKELKKIADEIELNDNFFQKRQFRIFGYNTIFHDKSIKKKEILKKEISKERALFPTMNPNLFGGLPSIFSCKPKLRVELNPGDVIFCVPNKSPRRVIERYFRNKNKKPPERCITLVMIVIKKINLKKAYKQLPFKACSKKHPLRKIEGGVYKTFEKDLIQAGDVTAKYIEEQNRWKFVGKKGDNHYHDEDNIKSLNDDSCEFKKYLEELAENEQLKLINKKACYDLNCKYRNKECKMKSGNWKYDILFKWGLLGSLKKSIPLEFRSFYLGSEGWTLRYFAKRIGAHKLVENIRNLDNKTLNERGPEILEDLRRDF